MFVKFCFHSMQKGVLLPFSVRKLAFWGSAWGNQNYFYSLGKCDILHLDSFDRKILSI